MEPSAVQIFMGGITIDCGNAGDLADFYARLLSWEKFYSSEEYAAVRSPDGTHILGFQTDEGYAPPVWPWETGKQGQMMHLDLSTTDVDAAVAHALSCGAALAPIQFYDAGKVLLDPAGHPFCLCPKR